MHPYHGKRPELGWSRHMTGGWRVQWERVQRWHQRLAKAQGIDRDDFLWAFFENAYHLRHWIEDTNAVDKEPIKNLFKRVEMRLCRDIVNSHKHRSLDKKPSQPIPPSEVFEYSPGTGNLSEDVSAMILSNGIKYDTFELAHSIFQTWEKFITEYLPEEAVCETE
jgi:hypothetical protein